MLLQIFQTLINLHLHLKLIANEVLSQNNIHKEYKGIVPELAARNHVLFIDKVLKLNGLKIAVKGSSFMISIKTTKIIKIKIIKLTKITTFKLLLKLSTIYKKIIFSSFYI